MRQVCKPGSVPGLPPMMTIHLVLPLRTGSSCQPGLQAEATLQGYPGTGSHLREVPIRHCSGWGLPCRSGCPSRGGLLPHRFTLTMQSWRSVFCGAFPWVAPAGRYPAPLPHGARTFLARRRRARSSDLPHRVADIGRLAARHKARMQICADDRRKRSATRPNGAASQLSGPSPLPVTGCCSKQKSRQMRAKCAFL